MTVKPTTYLNEVWPQRYPLDKRGRVRKTLSSEKIGQAHYEVRWDGEYDYRWYTYFEVEEVAE